MPLFSELVRSLEMDEALMAEFGQKLDWIASIAGGIATEIASGVASIKLPAGVPTGGTFIGIFTSGCPSGWTRFSALDNSFPRGAATYGGTGGASSHGHSGTDAHEHGNSGMSLASGGSHSHTYTTSTTGTRGGSALASRSSSSSGATTDGAGDHGHGAVSGTSDSTGTGISSDAHLPPYLDMVFCTKD